MRDLAFCLFTGVVVWSGASTDPLVDLDHSRGFPFRASWGPRGSLGQGGVVGFQLLGDGVGLAADEDRVQRSAQRQYLGEQGGGDSVGDQPGKAGLSVGRRPSSASRTRRASSRKPGPPR